MRPATSSAPARSRELSTAMHTATPVDGTYLALGGTAQGIAHATRDADDKVRAFLAKNL